LTVLGWTNRWLGRFAAAERDLRRGMRLARATGRFFFLCQVTVAAVRPLLALGRLDDALATAQDAVDFARLVGDQPQTVAAYCELAAVFYYARGDATSALQAADDAALIEAPRTLLSAAQPGWCRGLALIAAGNPARAVATRGVRPRPRRTASARPPARRRRPRRGISRARQDRRRRGRAVARRACRPGTRHTAPRGCARARARRDPARARLTRQGDHHRPNSARHGPTAVGRPCPTARRPSPRRPSCSS
jgi:hypothetical protein